MKANKNRFIEEWGTTRENLEHNFRWSRRNLALVGLFGIALPIFVYKGIVKEFVHNARVISWHGLTPNRTVNHVNNGCC